MPEMTCRSCGQVAHRVRTTFTKGNRNLPVPVDECELCGNPEGKITVPVDQKLWLTADANPNEYEYRDGTRVMKDWAQDELQQRIARIDPDEVEMVRAAKDRKRQHAREVRTAMGNKLTPEQVRNADEQLKEVMRRSSAEAAGLVLP